MDKTLTQHHRQLDKLSVNNSAKLWLDAWMMDLKEMQTECYKFELSVSTDRYALSSMSLERSILRWSVNL